MIEKLVAKLSQSLLSHSAVAARWPHSIKAPTTTIDFLSPHQRLSDTTDKIDRPLTLPPPPLPVNCCTPARAKGVRNRLVDSRSYSPLLFYLALIYTHETMSSNPSAATGMPNSPDHLIERHSYYMRHL